MEFSDNFRWKTSVQSDIQKVKDAIEKLANHVSLPDVVQSMREVQTSPSHNSEQRGQASSRDHQSRWELVVDTDLGPDAAPGSYLARSDPCVTTGVAEDIITLGIISYENAQACLDLYRDKLDHFPYRILGDRASCNLDVIRTASPLLLAAICSVSSLHKAPGDFDACYVHFRSIYMTRSIAKDPSVEDVRALCIGAFWLSDMSWILVGTAVRMATELHLQKSFRKALRGNREHYLRARLYLLVYACDHHFSIPFGRPPLTRQCDAIRNVRKFRQCAHATEDDARLVSQVLRWSLCADVFETYDADVGVPLTESGLSDLHTFTKSLDSLRAEWIDKFQPNVHVGNYPRKGVGLQCDFAKLYLCSHAFRGFQGSCTVGRSQEASQMVDTLTNEGIKSALSIINGVASDPEVQAFFNGLPVYFDIMLAFSVVFLFKVSSKYSNCFGLDIYATKNSVHNLLVIMKQITASFHPRHLLVDLTKGIHGILQRWCATDPVLSGNGRIDEQQTLPLADTNNNFEPDLFEGFLDPQFIAEYDLLTWPDFNMTDDMAFGEEHGHIAS